MKITKKILAVLLSLVLLLTLIPSLSMENVSAAQKKAKLNKSKATIYVGKTVTLKLKNNKKKVKWSSSNKKVATVSKKGKVTGKKAGKATITAKVGKKKYKCKVTVKKVAAPTKPNAPEQPTTKPSTPEQPTTKPGTPEQPTKPGTSEQPTNPDTPGELTTPVSPEVKWKVTAETFEGAYSYHNEETGKDEIIPKTLTRKYVSFSPWPTTNEQVEYVIKNCDDPFVVGALYIVALDNFEYKGLSNYTGEVYKMLDTLMSGAGTVTGSNYQLSNFAKQKICEFGMKQIATPSGNINVSTFASRAYLKGATPYNNYTPKGGMEDKTKWQIVMDEYVYCGDLANGYITVCPQRYTEEQETDGGPKKHVEHWQGTRIGMRYNKTAKVWLPTDNVSLNTPPTGALVPFNIEKQITFSSNYMAPESDQGF